MTKRQSGSIAFQPRARLLKLIGEELISDEIVAISELVKNAHDADAREVSLHFQGVTTPEGAIEIRDDGHGMNLETLLGRWMEPAASTKVGQGRQITKRGRRVLGEKGVGRFAADKLARNLEILSRCPGKPQEIRALVDWESFDDVQILLSEVKNRWELRPAQEIPRQGTWLKMNGLRAVWSERMFRRLSIRLARLLSPFRDHDPFAIRIQSDEFPDYSGDVRVEFLQRAPYRIEATFDGEQTIRLNFNDHDQHPQRWTGSGELKCGPLRIRLFAFDLEGEALARIGPRAEVRAWLREWTGVSVYRDGFRVWPFGEPHDDWLRLDQRRVNSPVDHLSNNQIIGFIEIGRDSNPDLMDQTNREGLIHTQSLDDLRRLVMFVLQFLEAERQAIRHPVRRGFSRKQADIEPETSVADELEILAQQSGKKLGPVLKRLGQKLRIQEKNETAQHRNAIEGYAGLATTGQMASGLALIIPGDIRHLREEMDHLRGILSHSKIPDARDAIKKMSTHLDSLMSYQRMLLAASGNGERNRTLDISAELVSFCDLFRPVLEARGVEMDLESAATELIRTEMRSESFMCILQALTMNALEALSGVPDARIRIQASVLIDSCEILFSDNGPGVMAASAAKMFDARFTTKEGHLGMGLTIARQMIESHGGSLGLLIDGRRKGAHFRIVLPRKRSRATLYEKNGTG